MSDTGLDEQIARLRRCEIITEKEVEQLCFKARFVEEKKREGVF